MESMLAASLRSPGALVLDERPIPTLGPRDVLLSVEATTLCGTDLRIATGQKTNGVTPGVVLGHEIAARVWRVGSDLTAGVDVPAPGTQVGLAPEIACGHCAPCTSGRSNVCANMRLFGTGVDGGLADFILIPEEALACITPVAREIAPPHLALAEPLSCCLRATTRLPIESDSRVLVLGTGPIGLIHCALAVSGGARVMACGRQARLEPARAIGAELTTSAQGEDLVREVLTWTDGVGADVVIIAVGVRKQRLGLVGRADLDVLADGQVVDRGEEDRVAHDAGDRVDDQLVRTGAVNDAGAASVDVARRGGTVAAAAATGRGGDGLGGHLVGALGGGVVSTAAAARVLGGGLGSLSGMGVSATVAVSAAAAAALLGGLLGARLLTFATTAAPAAAILGGDGVGIDQLEHLTVSHVFSLSFGPTGHFSEPYPV